MIWTLPERPYKQHLRTALTLLLDLIVTAAILLSIYYFNYLVPHRFDTSHIVYNSAAVSDGSGALSASGSTGQELSQQSTTLGRQKRQRGKKTIPVLTLPANLLPSFQIRSFQPQILIGARIFLFRSHPTRWAPAKTRSPTI